MALSACYFLEIPTYILSVRPKRSAQKNGVFCDVTPCGFIVTAAKT
jgi:hypothetical protein